MACPVQYGTRTPTNFPSAPASLARRSVKITQKDLSKRCLAFVDNMHEKSVEKEEQIVMTLDLLKAHVLKYKKIRDDEIFNDFELIAATSDEIQELRDKKHEEEQDNLVDNSAPEILVKLVSKSLSDKVTSEALTLAIELTADCNERSQDAMITCLKENDLDGQFMGSCRERLQVSVAALQEWRSVVEVNPDRARDFEHDASSCILTLQFFKNMCEGHNREMQNFLREQPDHVKSFDLVGEVLGMFGVQGKSMPIVRQMKDFEGELVEASLEFFVEAMQGPCSANQDLIAKDPKTVDICKNILSCKFPLIKDSKLKSNLQCLTITMLLSMLESREDDRSIHHLLQEQLPPSLLKRRLETLMELEATIARIKAGTKMVLVVSEDDDDDKREPVFREVKATAEETARSCDKLHAGLGEMDDDEKDELFEELLEISAAERKNVYALWSELESVSAADNPFRKDPLELVGQAGKKKKKKRGDRGGTEDKLLKTSADIRSVEIFWNNKTQRAFFTLPKEWQSFSPVAKKNFLDGADIDNAESRMKSLMDAGEKMYEEMQYQDKLTKNGVYKWYSDNFHGVKK